MATEPEKNTVAPAENAAPHKTGRHIPRRRMIQIIDRMAATGQPVTAAMETGLPLPSWDDSARRLPDAVVRRCQHHHRHRQEGPQAPDADASLLRLSSLVSGAARRA